MNKTAKDLAWDRERAKYRHRINELNEKIRLLTAEITEANALIENAEACICELRSDIEKLVNLNGMSPDDLRR